MKKVKYTFLFDLDGTITKKEILPEIAREVGLYDEISHLTRETINGNIPFHESFIKRVEMFRSIKASRVREVVTQVPINEELVTFIREYSDRCCIITGNLDVWVGELCEKIGVQSYTSKASISGDFVNGITYVLNKGEVSKNFSQPFVAVGEGNNDAEMIRKAAIGIAYGGVHYPASTVMACATHAIFEEAQLCRFLRQLL